jgi:hypothetical protein
MNQNIQNVLKLLQSLDTLLDKNLNSIYYNLESIYKVERVIINKYPKKLKNPFKIYKDAIKHKRLLQSRKPCDKMTHLPVKKNIFLCRKVNRNSRTTDSTSNHSEDSVLMGVVKKDNYWEVKVVNNGISQSIVYINSRIDAAKIYDYYAIKNGNVKGTNFSYSPDVVDRIVNSDDYKIMNMY